MISHDRVDITFGPRFTHRLRFCAGVFQGRAGPEMLADLIAGDGEPARVQVFVDSGLAAAQPALMHQVKSTLERTGSVHAAGAAEIVPGGEEVKNSSAALNRIQQRIHDARLCRRSYVLAIGGGAVLDAVGFAAATAHRGVRLIRVPTTTLAQADSCVAVKCGVNAFGKKNYLGVFAAPWAVVIDPLLTRTLSDRDWRCGFSEVVKAGLAGDAILYEDASRGAALINERDPAFSASIIRRSAEHHLRHITGGGDPFEVDHARPLDFGHWAAHRLEVMSGFHLRHGEAVAIGVAIDAAYSSLKGYLSENAALGVRETLLRLGFMLHDPVMLDVEGLLAGLDEFREHLGGRLTLSMLASIGKSFDIHDVDRAAMAEAIARVAALTAKGERTAGVLRLAGKAA